MNVDKVICDKILECAIMCDDQVRYLGKVLQYVSIVDRIFEQRERYIFKAMKVMGYISSFIL